MGIELSACKDCRTVTSTVYISNQQPIYNTIDYNFRQSYVRQKRIIPQQLSTFNKNYQELIASFRILNKKFYDNYFPAIDHSIGYKLFQKLQDIKWVRIEELYPNKNIFEKINQGYNGQVNNQIWKCFQQIQKHYELLNKLIPNQVILKQGIFIIYLSLNGQSRNPIQIVIDDLIPVDKNNHYVFGNQKYTIWMIILQKAFAKVLGNYQLLWKLKSQDFYQQLTGIPIWWKNWYQPTYYLESASHFLKGQQSLYYKFTVSQPTNIHLSVWQHRKNLLEMDINYLDIISELAYETNEGYDRIVYATTLKGNKTIISNDPQKCIVLIPGNYFLHIYGRYNKMDGRRTTLVGYSDHKVTFRLRDRNVMSQLKYRMVQRVFKDILTKKKVSIVKEDKGVGVRFYWDGHRGILCLKNQYPIPKQFQVAICQNKQSQVFFQDNDLKKVTKIPIKSQKHGFVYFIRRTDQDIGHFYEITIL